MLVAGRCFSPFIIIYMCYWIDRYPISFRVGKPIKILISWTDNIFCLRSIQKLLLIWVNLHKYYDFDVLGMITRIKCQIKDANSNHCYSKTSSAFTFRSVSGSKCHQKSSLMYLLITVTFPCDKFQWFFVDILSYIHRTVANLIYDNGPSLSQQNLLKFNWIF